MSIDNIVCSDFFFAFDFLSQCKSNVVRWILEHHHRHLSYPFPRFFNTMDATSIMSLITCFIVTFLCVHLLNFFWISDPQLDHPNGQGLFRDSRRVIASQVSVKFLFSYFFFFFTNYYCHGPWHCRLHYTRDVSFHLKSQLSFLFSYFFFLPLTIIVIDRDIS